MGPNGPALITSHLDAFAVSDNEELLSDLGELSTKLGNNYFIERLNELVKCEVRPSGVELYTGRIAFLPDKGGKTRLIAIGDYWTQSVVRPLHDSMMATLRQIPEDSTYDQDTGVRPLLSGDVKDQCHSIDLTSATDRFPVEVIETVISLLYDKEIAKL
jgi:hypothetical protein